MRISALYNWGLAAAVIWMAGCGLLGSDEKKRVPVEFRAEVSPQNSGQVSPTSRGYISGDTVTVEATAFRGYSFDNWSGDRTSGDNPLQFVIQEDTEITGNFVASSSEYRVSLMVADTVDTLRYLEFGQVLNATNAIDDLDDYAPPAQPSGLYGYFDHDQPLSLDFRNPETASLNWQLILQTGEQDSLFFSWDIEETFINGSLRIKNESSTVDADMLAVDELAVAVDQLTGNSLMIEYQLNN